MKIKKLTAALLCAAQLLGINAVFAEETATVDMSETAVADAEVNPNGEVRIYVSADGSDSNKGTFDSPVQSINKGISLATQLKSSNSGKTVAVTIRGGEYNLRQGIKLNSQHSGTEANPFVIQSYNGEEVKIMGSTKLSGRFKGVEDEEVLALIPEEARQYIGVYDLTNEISALTPYASAFNASITGTGYYTFIVNDTAQTLARWPNDDFDRTATVLASGQDFLGKEGASRAKRWRNATDAVAYGFFGSEYTGDSVKITEIGADGTIYLANRPSYVATINKRYYVFNLIEELDSPGEYYIDVKAKKLYYYPPYTISGASLQIATLVDPFFSGENLSNITFRGLTFENSRGYGLQFEKCSNIVIDDCEFANIGNIGIGLTNCTDCQVKNSSIHDIGGNAISVSGGDLQTLTSSGNVIDNNHIYDFAKTYRTNVPGIALSGVGTTITHNLIHGSASQAILYYGAEHKINYNEFYDLVNEACDAGAIYSGRNYTNRGNEIAYNYFHDIDTTADKGGSIFVCAIYMDDLNSSVNSHHNIMYNCNLGVMYGGGRDNKFDNNLIIDCNTGMFMDARGVGWAAYHAAEGGQAYKTIFTVPYDKEPWISKYPELYESTKDLANLGLPMNNSLTNNILYNVPSNTIAKETKDNGVYENNYDVKGKDMSVDGIDPNTIFKDYENKNFELREDSDLAKKYPEIASIDMSEMGLQGETAEKAKATAEETHLRLISPWNGAAEITNLGYTFRWGRNPFASKYIVEIAEDPEMENIILTEETIFNVADIKFIPSGGKEYWWTVTGVGESQSVKGEFEQAGPPRKFVSAVTEQTDKKELRSNITTLTKLNAAIIEGTTPGTYKKGFKERVELLLTQATAINNSSTVLQKDIEAINAEYDELIASIKDNINYEVVNVGDLLKNQSAWTTAESESSGEGFYTFGSDDTLTLKGPKGKNNYYSHMVYDEPLGDNVAVKFGYNVTVSSNYCVIGLQSTSQFLGNANGYNIIIKSGNVEVQKYVIGTTGDRIKANFLNFYIPDGKWVDLEFGALKTGIGTYVYLTADGQLVADFFDTEEPFWTGESRFVFGNPSGSSLECIASIRAAQD